MELNFFFLNGRGDADSTKGGGRGDPCPVNQARAVIGGSKGKVGQGLGSPTLTCQLWVSLIPLTWDRLVYFTWKDILNQKCDGTKRPLLYQARLAPL